MKCELCLYENVDGTRYCQRCGKLLKTKPALFAWGKTKHWAGTGQKGTNMAPLGAMAVEKQAEELGKVTVSKMVVKVFPLEAGRWYCPDCGELNGKSALTCKGCGRDFS